MQSILGPISRDLSLVILPGLICIAVAEAVNGIPVLASIAMLIGIYFADAGHVYTTVFRFDRSSKKYQVFILAPLVGFFLLFAIWPLSGLPGMWSLVIYMTLIHNLRQIFGIRRWYYRLEHRTDKPLSQYLFYLSYLLPFIAMHFHPQMSQSDFYLIRALWIHPSLQVYNLMFYGSFLLGATWIATELWQQKTWKAMSSLYPFSQWAIYIYVFLFARSEMQMMLPLVVSHGVAYMALIHHSRIKVYETSKWLPIIMVALAGGAFEYFTEYSESRLTSPLLASCLVALPLAALFTHYYADTFIWKGSDPDARKIYS